MLRTYDLVVLGCLNRFVWRCPTHHTVQLYRQHLASRHLEIGVGTGQLLHRAIRERKGSTLILADSNPTCLTFAARRLRRLEPRLVRSDIRQANCFRGADWAPVDSVGMNYVLHCLAGGEPAKKTALQNAREAMHDRGVLFGSTICAEGVRHTALSNGLMHYFNRREIFSNHLDSAAQLKSMLQLLFRKVETRSIGAVVLFSAQKPKVAAYG